MIATEQDCSPVESIDGLTFRRFADMPAQDQAGMLSQWSERAAYLLEAGTLPIRLKGQALAMKVSRWAAAVGVCQ